MIRLPKDYEKSIPHYHEYKKTLKLSPVAQDLLQQRYLKRNEDDEVVEDFIGMFYRVAKNIAQADMPYGENAKASELKFFHHLVSLDLVPASPILMNAGNTLQHLFSDHALDVPDSMEDIFEVLKLAATIQQRGGGLGFSFSKIRPRHDSVSGMKHVAFGPLSVMHIFDTSFSAILQGGRRSGANMAILDITHPDVLSFIRAKEQLGALSNFNLSVAVTDDFLDAVKKDKEFDLINPRTQEVAKTVFAKDLFDAIIEQAWRTGDPGIVFIDQMNAAYPFKNSNVLCTGSCGQYELESLEGVPYIHINLTHILVEKDGKTLVDEQKLRYLVAVAVHFLDNCIDMHAYTTEEIKRRTKQVRKIGLGVLGFADMLFRMGIAYGSQECLRLIEQVMSIIQEESRKASHQFALKRKPFPALRNTIWKQPMRNATITSIAPTGSTSIIAGVSQSIEPVYAFSFTTTTSSGKEYTILNESFKQAVDSLALDRVAKIQLQFVDSVQKLKWLDPDFKQVFKTAIDVTPQEHVQVMAAFQKYIDNSISKTINLPHHATQEDVAQIMWLAHELKCKGITIYRDGCRDDQVLAARTQTRLSAFEDEQESQT